MKKMFVSSFYNTLINKEDAIPMSTMLEIDNLRRKGIFFTVLTNKNIEEVTYYNKDYPFIDYIISLNGSITYDAVKNKIINSTPLDKNIIKKLEEKIDKNKITYYTEDNIIYKIEIKNTKKIREILEKLEIYYTTLKINKTELIEISSTTPYNALIELMRNKKITKDEVVGVVGNNCEEDIIKNLDNFYIIQNSPKSLKELSKNKTKSNNNKGVEIILKSITKE